MTNYTTDYFIIAENVIPGENNKQTIVNAFDEVYAPKLPTAQQLLALAIKIRASEELQKDSTINPTLEVIDPTGAAIGTFEIDPIAVTDSPLKGVTLGIGAHGMPLEHYGEYTFNLYIDGKKIESRILTVKGER